MKSNAKVACVSFLIACCGALIGCEEAEPRMAGGQSTCIQGQTVGCNCSPTMTGFTMCTAQGVPGACMCGVTTGGSGGAGGAAGMAMSSGGVGGGGGMLASGGASGAAGMMALTGGAGGMIASGGMGGSGGMETTGGMGGSMTGGTGGEVPDDDACAEVSDWDPSWADFEEEVLRLTNEARAEGADCGAEGTFGPTDPLTMSPILRCSSRLHSMDMGEQGYFAHDSLDGRSPFDRMADAGYSGRTMGENIAKGQQSPAEVVAGWIDSDGHCRNIMNPGYTEIGVGYWQGEPENMFFNGNKLWTQNFGTPAGGGNGTCPWPPQFCP